MTSRRPNNYGEECRKYETAEKWCRSFLSSGQWLETDSEGRSRFYELVAEESENVGYPVEVSKEHASWTYYLPT